MGAKEDMAWRLLEENEKRAGFLSGLAFLHGIRSKINLVAMGIALYSGALYHDTIDRVQDFVLYRNQPIQERFFQDPYGIDIRTRCLDDGLRGVYLCHERNGNHYALERDMYPSTGSMVEVLGGRLEDMGPDERSELLDDLEHILEEYR